jgi:protein tyrosine phosphatase
LKSQTNAQSLKKQDSHRVMSAKCTSGCGRTGTYFFFLLFSGRYISDFQNAYKITTLKDVQSRQLVENASMNVRILVYVK